MAAGDREIKLTVRVGDDGTLSVLNAAGRKISELGRQADQANKATAAGFSQMEAAALTWTEFLKGRMGPAMKEAMAQGLTHAEAHKAAITQLSQQYHALKDGVATAGAQNTQFASTAQQSTSVVQALRSAFGSLGAAVIVANQGIQLAQFAWRSMAGPLIEIADSFRLFEGRIRAASAAGVDSADVMQRLIGVAQETRTDVSSIGEMYARFALATREMGVSQEQLLALTSTVSKATIVSGATTTEATNALIQFSQALASGRFSGDELRSVLEQLPRLARAIAQGMGISVGDLRRFGQEGKLVPGAILEAIQKTAPEIEDEFARMSKTFRQLTTVASTNVKQMVAEFDKSTNAAEVLGLVVVGLSERIRAIDVQAAIAGFREWGAILDSVTLHMGGALFKALQEYGPKVIAWFEMLAGLFKSGWQSIGNIFDWAGEQIAARLANVLSPGDLGSLLDAINSELVHKQQAVVDQMKGIWADYYRTVTQGPQDTTFVGPPAPKPPVEPFRFGNKATLGMEEQQKAAKALAKEYENAYDAQSILAQSELEAAQYRLELASRGTISDWERLALQAEIDAAERRVLEVERDRYNTQVVYADELKLTPAEIAKAAAEYQRYNVLIDRSSDGVAKMRAELEKSHRVTMDLGGSISSSLKGAVSSIFSGDRALNVGELLKGSVATWSSDFIGGLIEAETAKDKWDYKVTENFTVKLPGWMKTGADAMTSTWTSALTEMEAGASVGAGGIVDAFTSAFSGIATAASHLAEWLGGTLRNVPGVGNVSGLLGDMASVGGLFGGGSTQAGSSAITRMIQQSGSASMAASEASNVGPVEIEPAIPSAAMRGGAGTGFMDVLGTTGAAMGGASILNSFLGLSSTEQMGGMAGAGAGALAGLALEPVLGPLAPILGAVLGDVVGSLIGSLFNGGPTGEHKKFDSVRDAWGQSGLWTYGPAWGDHSIIDRGEEGIFANQGRGKGGASFRMLFPGGTRESEVGDPRISAMTGGAAAIGTLAFGGDATKGAYFANSFVVNARLLGITADMAKDQLRDFARAAGVDANKAIGELTNQLMSGKISVDEYKRQVVDMEEIFTDDLPPGVDLSTIALRHFLDANGKAVFDVAAFNEELARQAEIFGNLQRSIESGGLEGIRAYLAGGTAEDFRSAFATQIRQGAFEAISQGALDAVKALPQYSAFEDALAAAVQSGTTTGLGDAFMALEAAAFPVLDKWQAAAKQFYVDMQVTPTQLRSDAKSVREQIDQLQLGHMSRKGQLAQQSGRLAEIDALLAGGGLSNEERRKLLEEKRGIGEWYTQYAGNYAQGSRLNNQYFGTGIGILEQVGTGLEDFATEQDKLIQAIIDNTAATNKNTTNLNDWTNTNNAPEQPPNTGTLPPSTPGVGGSPTWTPLPDAVGGGNIPTPVIDDPSMFSVGPSPDGGIDLKWNGQTYYHIAPQDVVGHSGGGIDYSYLGSVLHLDPSILHAGGIPGYARGGIAWTPQIASLAEYEPELITPLSQLNRSTFGGDNQLNDAVRALTAAVERMGSPLTVEKIETNVNGVSDARSAADTTKRMVRAALLEVLDEAPTRRKLRGIQAAG